MEKDFYFEQLNTKNGIFQVDPNDLVIGKGLRERGEWGFKELERLFKIVAEESRVLVVGAHIGTLAIPLSKRVKKVVAIEANPKTYKLLNINVSLNSLENCQTHCIAASDKVEKLKFLLNTSNSGGSKRKPIVMDQMYIYDNPDEITVDAVPLDDYLSDQIFDLIIMDIEGSEYHALTGMTRLLENVQTLVVEFVPHHLRNVSAVSLEKFVNLFNVFNTLYWPGRDLTVSKCNFSSIMGFLFHNDIVEDGLIFSKQNLT
ncbi:methyltransferase, FkbM family [Pedobacter terrae]|uniref:Methyltransferase, FkbM family n=1 Tax=Pedobacter terrae TaxID=405671 RepID=A0A1G8CK19_9SPHI|nr:FkbM family methyltransferase [Pedobacter terrae]SDH45220.1 methyltransferase, FkbM family [Pedobacter terrae]